MLGPNVKDFITLGDKCNELLVVVIFAGTGSVVCLDPFLVLRDNNCMGILGIGVGRAFRYVGFGFSCNNLDADNNYIGKIPNKLASFS